MKAIIFTIAGLLQLNAFAVTGSDLLSARNSALEEASVELDLNTVTAFEVKPSSHDEIEVALKANNETVEYGCHFHGNEMICHEEGHHHVALTSEEGSFEYLMEGHEAALAKFGKTLEKQKSSLDALKSMKVWIGEQVDHAHSADVITKVVYDRNGKTKVVYIQCHEHGHHVAGGHMACHYKMKVNGEPTL